MGRVTSLLAALLSLGAGISVGFGIFYLRYKDECQSLLQFAGSKATSDSSSLQTQVKKSQDAYNSCIKERSSCQDEHAKAVAGQNSLTTKHEKLVQEQAQAVDKLAQLEKDKKLYMQKVQSLEDKIDRLKELGSGDTQKVEALTQQLQLAQSMLSEKIQQVSTLESQLQEGGGGVFASAQALVEMKRDIQRQHLAQTLLQYQTRGPFSVEFTLESGEERGETTLVVELNLVEETSMTVSTFLKLVQAGLYEGTTIQPSQNTLKNGLTGGNPKQATSKRVQATLERRYAEHGYGMEPFLWQELVDKRAACIAVAGAFWFPSRGPQFQLTLPASLDAPLGSRNPSCQGHVVSGISALQQTFQQQEGDAITIVKARVLLPGDSNDRDEL